jgi:hypothetical protein
MTIVGSPDFIRALGWRPCSRRHRVRHVTRNGAADRRALWLCRCSRRQSVTGKLV